MEVSSVSSAQEQTKSAALTDPVPEGKGTAMRERKGVKNPLVVLAEAGRIPRF